LYNYLFARKHGGTMILRIEDTDQNRFVPGAEQYISDSLSWCGIEFDESPLKGGPHAPYRQSERSAVYRRFAEQLLSSGNAYYAFDTESELEAIREKMKADGKQVFQYDARSRQSLRNSLVMPEGAVRELIDSGTPFVVRIRIPENETVVLNDLIRGRVEVHSANLDDKVLFKSDGLPTYHLANVVDDYLMKITHVIRGEEWLPSAPLHVLLYRFLGWESVMPAFAHLPLILKPDGNGKLSKRDGDRLGFPVFPLEWHDPKTGELYSGYRESGFLPEAVLNIVAHLGWNPGTEQELFTLDELIGQFSLDRVGKHGSKFDPEKARWFNHQYLLRKSDEELAAYLEPELERLSVRPSGEYLAKVLSLTKERAFLAGDLWCNAWFFFERPGSYDPQVKEKIWKPETPGIIRAFAEEASEHMDFTADIFHTLVQDFTQKAGIKAGQLMNPLRLLLVGSNQGPGITDIAALLGREEFLARVRVGLERL